MSRRTRELSSSTRSEILISIGATLFFVAMMLWRFGPAPGRFQQLAYAAVIAWILISVYGFRDRLWRKEAPRPDALAATGLDYYRRELERRRDHLRNEWVWHGPLFLACMIFIASLMGKSFYTFRGVENLLPLLVLLAAWTGFSVWRRRRQANELQREIDEIKRL